MTDEQIIKALECSQYYDCVDCPHYQEDCVDLIKDPNELSKYALDLINRQQAEIERLKKAVDIHKGIAEDWKHEANRLKEMVGDTE